MSHFRLWIFQAALDRRLAPLCAGEQELGNFEAP